MMRALTQRTAHADSPLEGVINSISVAVTNFQPLNSGKKWLAGLQAGDYSEAEISAKLDRYIQDNPVRPPASSMPSINYSKL